MRRFGLHERISKLVLEKDTNAEVITHDFFCLRMAVETSSGPGCEGAPLGSAMCVYLKDEDDEM